METLGATSHTTWPGVVPFDGVKTALQACQILMVVSTSRLLSGTRKSKCQVKHSSVYFELISYSGHLKERLFGLSNPQGVHGESIKECHFHLDNTPTHSYMKYLYKLPQKAFPYEEILKENQKRSKKEREYNLIDTGIFNDNKYWDCFVETAKEKDNPDELLFRVTCYNRGSEPAKLHILPHVWFRNTWAWGYDS